MNAQAFSDLIKNPALLGKFSLWELQELAQEHPYSSVVYSLVALKAYQEGDSNYEHYLNQAALRIADRKKLFELIHADYEPVTEAPVSQATELPLPLGDDFETVSPEHPAERHIETQHLASPSEGTSQEKIPTQEIEKEEPASAETPREFSAQAETVEVATAQHEEKTGASTEEVESIIEETKSVTEELTPETPAAISIPSPTIDLPGADEVLEALGGLKISKKETDVEAVEAVSEVSGKPTQPEKPVVQKSDTHSFSEWLSLLTKGAAQPQEPAMQEETVAELLQPEPAAPEAVFQPEPAEEATEEEKEIDEILISKQAKASLAQDDELVTETLAKIYELQKKYDKAIKVYQTLSLKYPDKMAYFADKIEKLKNK